MRHELRLRVLLPIAVLGLLGLGVGAMAFTGTPAEDPAPLPVHKPAAKKPSDPRLTPKQWRKQANAVCGNLNREVAKLGAPQSPEDVAKLLPATLALADKALGELEGLRPPKRDAADVRAMLTALGLFVRLEKRAATALSNRDVEAFVNLNAKAFEQNDRGSRLARALGAGACAKGASADSKLERQLKRHRVVVTVLYTPGSSLDSLMVREARAGADAVRAGFVAVDVTDTRSIAALATRYNVRNAPAVLVFVRWRGAVVTFTDYVDRATVAQAAENAGL